MPVSVGEPQIRSFFHVGRLCGVPPTRRWRRLTRRSAIVLTALITLVLAAAPAVSAVPATMSYQGVLTAAGGVPLPNGDYALTFRIYDVAAGGTPLWQEIQSIPVADGVFDAILGTVGPLDLPFDAPYWLGVSVAADPELAPRTELTSAPYALRAAVADAAGADTDWVIDGDDMHAGVSGGVTIGGSGLTWPGTKVEIDEGALLVRWPHASDQSPSVYVRNFTGSGGITPGIGTYGVWSGVGSDGSERRWAVSGHVTGVGGDMRAVYGSATPFLATSWAGYFERRGYFSDDLGVGTSAPAAKLDVVGTTRTEGFEMPTGAADGHVLTSDATGAASWQPAQGIEDDGDWTVSGDDVYAAVSGNVEVGTTTPYEKLHVHDDAGRRLRPHNEQHDRGWSEQRSQARSPQW